MRRKVIMRSKKLMKQYLESKKQTSESEMLGDIKNNVYLRIKEFFGQLLSVLDYSLTENNFFHFDELMS